MSEDNRSNAEVGHDKSANAHPTKLTSFTLFSTAAAAAGFGWRAFKGPIEGGVSFLNWCLVVISTVLFILLFSVQLYFYIKSKKKRDQQDVTQ